MSELNNLGGLMVSGLKTALSTNPRLKEKALLSELPKGNFRFCSVFEFSTFSKLAAESRRAGFSIEFH